MQLCSAAPSVGYYTQWSSSPSAKGHASDQVESTTETGKQYGEIFGVAGDFVTAPEISQMFGELLAVWIYYELKRYGFNGDEPVQIIGELLSYGILPLLYKAFWTPNKSHLLTEF